MRVRKAVITAAGKAQRNLPLQALVDRNGQQKTALMIIIEEAISAGVNEIGIVVYPGDESAYSAAAGEHVSKIQFISQTQQRGYGYGVYCAKSFIGAEPFLHLVSDHLYISSRHDSGKTLTCAQQLIEIAEHENCSVSAVQATRENMLPYYGIIGGRRIMGQHGLYLIENVREKPTPTEAEQTLIVPGLRAGYYLAFFGMHVLTHGIMNLLESQLNAGDQYKSIQLSPSLAQLSTKERYLAFEVLGKRYDIGVHYGMLTAQLALALSGSDRDEVLAQLVELLATREL